MKTKHTPGPWKVDKEGFNVWNEKDRIAFTGTERVNSMGGVGAFPIDERKANAKIMAAAPDLLQALYTINELCGSVPPDTIAKIAMAAIKKATE